MMKLYSLIITILAATACGGNEPVPATPAQPSADTAQGTTDTAGAAQPPEGVEKVIAELSPDFQRCYGVGREKDAKLEGSTTIEAKLGPNGEVTSSAAIETKGLTLEVTDCLASSVKSSTFPAPGEKGATIRIPVALKPGS